MLTYASSEDSPDKMKINQQQLEEIFEDLPLSKKIIKKDSISQSMNIPNQIQQPTQNLPLFQSMAYSQKFGQESLKAKINSLEQSKTLQLSKARTNDTLTKQNLTYCSNLSLQNINRLINFKDVINGGFQQRISRRLKKKIQNLRLYPKSFTYNIEIRYQAASNFKYSDFCTLNSQAYLRNDAYIQKFEVTPDYHRQYNILPNQNDQYLAISSTPITSKIILSTNRQQILIYDINQNKQSSEQLENNVTNIQINDKNQDLAILGAENGQICFYDLKSNKQSLPWFDITNKQKMRIKNIDSRGYETIVSYSNQFYLFDNRKPENILLRYQCQNDKTLNKAQFTLLDRNIMFIEENSSILNIYNTIKDSLLQEKDLGSEILDVQTSEFWQDLMVLSSNQLDHNKFESLITVISNKSSQLKIRDQIQCITSQKIQMINLDKNNQFLYALNPQYLRAWKMGSLDELNLIKDSFYEISTMQSL